MASRAIPSHLKPSAAEGGEGGFSSQRHHGKSQSHVVSTFSLFLRLTSLYLAFSSLISSIRFVAAKADAAVLTATRYPGLGIVGTEGGWH
jgi:hypothetical protein